MLGLCLIISRAARYLPKLALALNNIPSLCVYYNLYDRRCEMINLWQVYYMVNEPDLCMRHNAVSRWLWRSPSCPAVLQPTLRKKIDFNNVNRSQQECEKSVKFKARFCKYLFWNECFQCFQIWFGEIENLSLKRKRSGAAHLHVRFNIAFFEKLNLKILKN